ncbi:MAG: riboflavin synthase [Alphaproteobacteria bacterium]|nr:riboflavin synthase [Alphaproteobacteria bacterium]
MFTGIVTDMGRVRAVSRPGDTRFEIATAYDIASLSIGASVACSGPCLTVVAKGEDKGERWFAVEASAETLSKTTAGQWRVGTLLNLERALKVGDELGGHIVSGHVDGTGQVISVRPEGGSIRLVFEAPDALARYIAPKGSIAIEGVSLTVNEVEGARFGVNIIPHTAKMTTLGSLTPGMAVNLEIDVLARYVARLQAA